MALLAIMTMSALAFRAALGGQQEPCEPSSIKLEGWGAARTTELVGFGIQMQMALGCC